MIVVDGEKYACERCIRGHRSSTCRHIERALVLVRSRGRPLTDSSQRIAIHAEKPECCCSSGNSSGNSSGSGKCKCTSNTTKGSVIVLKASKRQVFNVNKDSLKLLDPVVEVTSVEKGLEVMNRQKSNPPLLETTTTTTTTNNQSNNNNNNNNSNFIQFKVPIPTTQHSPLPEVGLNGAGQLFDMYYADSCVVPGSCLCDPENCLCERCIEHHLTSPNKNQSIQEMFNDFPFATTSSLGHIELKREDELTSLCLCPDDNCSCFNCDLHGISNGVKIPKDQLLNQIWDNYNLQNDINKSTCCSKTSKLKVTATEFPINFNDPIIGSKRKKSITNSQSSCCKSSDLTSNIKKEKDCCSSISKKSKLKFENDSNNPFSKTITTTLTPPNFDIRNCISPDDSCICSNCFNRKFTNIQ